MCGDNKCGGFMYCSHVFGDRYRIQCTVCIDYYVSVNLTDDVLCVDCNCSKIVTDCCIDCSYWAELIKRIMYYE